MHHLRASFDQGKKLSSGYHQHKRLLELQNLDATANPHACRMIIRCGEDQTAVGAELCTSDPAVSVPSGLNQLAPTSRIYIGEGLSGAGGRPGGPCIYVIVRYAPIHEPAAANATYIQLLV